MLGNMTSTQLKAQPGFRDRVLNPYTVGSCLLLQA